ncbi:MAG: T9SS type A sorting domain-containing protein [Sporocytophaga sp.]|uniref:T9SS type A sorting domain-containing protein n=1 Tax=Sporocytophaga sp. TaxID=2231183 RepID=UPI001AFF2F0A|nr:T9SS type A sorting domain-containing protein [Sporocytophaga sp.]MBO9702422.1 T9SS type A sorting domain-containing protein [Sporocytophaga sp.]
MRFILYLSLIFSYPAFSQISGVINTYAKVTVIDETCNSVTIAPASGFSVGDKVLIIQMKGAQIDQNNSTAYGNLTGTGLGSAGNYEINEVAAINGSVLYLKYELIRTYDPAGKIQVVNIPIYSDVTISGVLTSAPWDGDTGGILIFESTGDVTMNADIDVSGKGFKGGECSANGGDCDYILDGPYNSRTLPGESGKKGEGVAEFSPGMESGRGKQLNGGGAGLDLNSGGAGGGNYGKGGDGGSISSGCKPVLGFAAKNNFGLGGVGFSTTIETQNKIFLGGGGGGGHQDNSLCNAGGNGGGIVIVKAVRIEGNGHSILANGNSVAENLPDHGDGNGGGGAGGTVLLDASVSSSFISTPPNINVVGGKGGNTNDQNSPGKNFGPGGGGGGGVVWLKGAALPVLPIAVLGGSPGTSRACACSHGAVQGSNGATLLNLAIPISNPEGDGVCYKTTSVQLLNYTATCKDGFALLSWNTIAEIDNKLFTIEKSEDGIHFFEIGRVTATNNSSVTSAYFYSDDLKGEEGKYYYKLSQTDDDGTVNFLGIRSVSIDGDTKLVHSVYPNPFTRSVTIQLNKDEEDVTISIVDMTGRTVLQSNVNNTKDQKIVLFDEHISSGPYILIVRSNEVEEKILLIKE